MQQPNEHTPPISEATFIRLFVRHEPALRAYAHSILPDWEWVDDALQEASVTMWQKRGQLWDEEGFLPWAKVILRFKCFSLASAARRDRHVFSDEVLKLLADEAEAISSHDVACVRRALRECIAQFSPPHQELLLAPYAGDGRVLQLARQCGKSANALYKLLGRLREKLAACVRKQIELETA